MTRRIGTLVAVAVVGELLALDLAAPASADEALAPATEYVVPGGQVFGIAFGPDGNLWFAAGSAGIGRMTTAGTFSFFALPDGAIAEEVAAGGDGRMWFTTAVAVGAITLDGDATLYPLPGHRTTCASRPDRTATSGSRSTSTAGWPASRRPVSSRSSRSRP